MKKGSLGDKGLALFKPKANAYLHDKKKAAGLISSALKKASAMKNKGPMEEIYEKLLLVISIFRDYTSGKYRRISISSILIITAAIVYFVCPADLIPDVPPFGYIDDASVVAFVLAQVNSELEKYKEWKRSEFQQQEHRDAAIS